MGRNSKDRLPENSSQLPASRDGELNPGRKNPRGTEGALFEHIVRNIQIGLVILELPHGAEEASAFRIIDLNPAAAEITGFDPEEVVGKTLRNFPSTFQTGLANRCLEVLRTGQAQDLGKVSCGDERVRPAIYAVRTFPLPNRRVGIAFEDVSDYERSQAVVRESEERLRFILAGVKDYAIVMLDAQGYVVSWSAGAEGIKGYNAEEIIGKHFSVFYPSESVLLRRPQWALAEAAAKGRYVEECWQLRKDASRFWANVVLTTLRDEKGVPRGFVEMTRDVTGRREREEILRRSMKELELQVEERTRELTKTNRELEAQILHHNRVEEQLQSSLEALRALAERLQRAREEERTHVAREIHDEFGQSCTALKMDLTWLTRKLPKKEKLLHDRAESMMKLIDIAIQNMRRIASELRPRILDDLGLTASIEWQAQEFTARTGIPCELHLQEDDVAVDPAHATALFRIFQETMTNVARHARASRVFVKLHRELERVVLEVRDDGVGITETQAQGSTSLGLLGMRERATILGGEFMANGIPGQGTAVTVRLPLR